MLGGDNIRYLALRFADGTGGDMVKKTNVALGVAGGASAACVAGPLMIIPSLSLLGFSSVGPVAGSYAAG